MPNAPLYQQSSHYSNFQCTGAVCEDTCCSGWQISVDRPTHEKYQACSHPVLRPQLDRWIQIQPTGPEPSPFAKIVLQDSTCPFLAESLCSIQKTLGADHLSQTCATFPRIRNRLESVVASSVIESSLDLSCPEAARLCLTDPNPASFHQVPPGSNEELSVVSTPGQQYPYFWEIRSAILRLLQNRKFPVAKRLLLAGHICTQLDELTSSGHVSSVPQMLEGSTVGIDAGFYNAHLAACQANAADQLTIVLELMVARIKLDFTPQRYRDLYQEFAAGLALEPGLNVRACAARYSQAYTKHYLPFLASHEHMLEHYLVYFAYRTLFPFSRGAGNDHSEEAHPCGPFTRQYLLLAAYFAMIRTTMVGLAARHGSHFTVDHAIRCIQVSSRTLEHCTSYPAEVLRILFSKGIVNTAAMSKLTQDPASNRFAAATDGFARAASL